MIRYYKVKECVECGSNNLEFNVVMRWSTKRQQYEPTSYYEPYCHECGDNVDSETRVIEDRSLENVKVI